MTKENFFLFQNFGYNSAISEFSKIDFFRNLIFRQTIKSKVQIEIKKPISKN